MIPPRIHGVIDYVYSSILIVVGLYFGIGTTAGAVPAIIGAGSILYSLMTAYELGLVKLIPFKGHLALDIAGALVLGGSPWIFGFADRVWLPHVGAAILELIVVAMSQRVPLRTTASGPGRGSATPA